MNTTIYFSKVKENAIIPNKRIEDAGMDIYACFDEEFMIIKPHETKLIPTGIASVCSDDYYFQLEERGSTGTKGMGNRCGVIDSGYRSEWFVPITNHNNVPLIISKNTDVCAIVTESAIVYPYAKAICQAVLLPVPKVNIVEISHDELLKVESERGTGSLGSSGK